MAVGQQSPGTQGEGGGVGRVQRQRLRQVRVGLEHDRLLALLVLAGHLAVARLDAVLLHGEGPVHLVVGEERAERGGGQPIRIWPVKLKFWDFLIMNFIYMHLHQNSAYSVIKNMSAVQYFKKC